MRLKPFLPPWNRIPITILSLTLAILPPPPLPAATPAPPNQLTDEEKAQGWQLLFDGVSSKGWRGFKQKDFPVQGWRVEDGWLKKIPQVRGGDIITQDLFDDFDLTWEWTIAPGGNNGVKYFITESRGGAIGHEYQMMDDKGETGVHSTASFYEVLAASPDKPMKPAGEINHSRITVRGDQVAHWLNGDLVLRYTLGSPEVLRGVAASKFRNVPGFGSKLRGHILLTDHQDGAAFRSIKIRNLNP